MLQSLKLVGVGPAPEMEMRFAPRLNVLTGDNGLGKSLFLETIWYVLTGNWAGLPAWPRTDAREAKVEFHVDDVDTGPHVRHFYREKQAWDGLGPIYYRDFVAIYARIDGSVAVWDPARSGAGELLYESGIVFSQTEMLHGKRDERNKPLCRGLIEDWVTWQDRKPESLGGSLFARFALMLEKLSPNPNGGEEIRLVDPIRLFVWDSREIPRFDAGYGPVPIIHASAAMQRIISLAYLILWTWHEHEQASRLLGRDSAKKIVFLMDEVENHLHPEWQRRILPALLRVLESLGDGMQVQMHVTTHSPLVLASLEPHWNNERDQLFHFALKDGKVVLDSEELGRWGTASRWLKSRVFGLSADRSLEAERAMEDANAFMRGEEPKYFKTPEEVDSELRRTLPGQDPFWPRWLIFMGDADK